jgi:hypothetical protein
LSLTPLSNLLQTWLVYKFYTDFLRLRNEIEHSQFYEVALDLPPKHPLRLRLRMKFSFSKRRAYRKEIGFIRFRMQSLELWLNKVLREAAPGGVQHVQFLNEFFGAFPDDEPYNRAVPRRVHAKIGTSMYHALRSMAVPMRVYDRLWAAGYCFESLGAMTVVQWRDFGVSPVLATTLFSKFHRKDRSIPIPGAAAAARRSRNDGAMRERAFSDAAAMAAVADLRFDGIDGTPPPYTEKYMAASAPAEFSRTPPMRRGGPRRSAPSALARTAPSPSAPPLPTPLAAPNTLDAVVSHDAAGASNTRCKAQTTC